MKRKEDFQNSYILKAVNDRAHIHVAEDNEAEIEGVRSVVEYSSLGAVFNMGGYNLAVWGEGLVLKGITKASITVLGRIQKIEFMRKDG